MRKMREEISPCGRDDRTRMHGETPSPRLPWFQCIEWERILAYGADVQYLENRRPASRVGAHPCILFLWWLAPIISRQR
jgi:hypothetical protein